MNGMQWAREIKTWFFQILTYQSVLLDLYTKSSYQTTIVFSMLG